MKTTVCVCVLFAAFTVSSFTQPRTVLSNTDVIEMSKGGLPVAVILAKIRTSEVDFKTDVPSLKLLTDEGVAESIISAMVEKQAEISQPKPPINYTRENAEHGTLLELKHKTKVFVAIEDAQSRQIVISAIGKHLTIVNDRKDADFAINFRIGRVDVGSNALLNTVHNIVVVGELYAYTYLPVEPGQITGRIRVLWLKRKQQDWSGGITFSRHPAKNAINDFLNDLKKVNKQNRVK